MDQHAVDDAVRSSWNLASGSEAQWGVRVWTDADEWAVSAVVVGRVAKLLNSTNYRGGRSQATACSIAR